MASNSKAKKFKLTYHMKVAKNTVNEPNELRHKSTQYVSSHLGQVNVSTSFLSTTEVQAIPPDPQTDLPCLDNPFIDKYSGEDAVYVQYLEDNAPEPPPRKNAAEDNPMATWLLERDRFIEELLTLEGRGPDACDACCICKTQQMAIESLFECVDCTGRLLQCQACIVNSHQGLPCHRIQ
ncbi:hypothetical protein H0H92_003861, partial [Tricholoma furcatifolium]